MDSKWTSGNLLASESYIDDMRSFHHGAECAAKNTVAPVLQYDLYSVPATLRVYNDHSYITGACTYKDKLTHVPRLENPSCDVHEV